MPQVGQVGCLCLVGMGGRRHACGGPEWGGGAGCSLVGLRGM